MIAGNSESGSPWCTRLWRDLAYIIIDRSCHGIFKLYVKQKLSSCVTLLSVWPFCESLIPLSTFAGLNPAQLFPARWHHMFYTEAFVKIMSGCALINLGCNCTFAASVTITEFVQMNDFPTITIQWTLYRFYTNYNILVGRVNSSVRANPFLKQIK